MKRQLVITDLTRMQDGRVCVAGYDAQGNCVRPVLPPPGIHETSLTAGGRPVVFPFAAVEYDLLEPTPQPPHTEDWRYHPASVRFVRRLSEAQSREVLDGSTFASVAAVFEQPILHDPGHYVLDGQGPRSLGTVRPTELNWVIYAEDEAGKWDYRLRFTDGEGQTYRLKVTDLAWRYYCDRRREQGHEASRIAMDLKAMLNSRSVYLRIGLARRWDKFPDRCYLQITGVHTFPDYLEGKTFADLASTV